MTLQSKQLLWSPLFGNWEQQFREIKGLIQDCVCYDDINFLHNILGSH